MTFCLFWGNEKLFAGEASHNAVDPLYVVIVNQSDCGGVACAASVWRIWVVGWAARSPNGKDVNCYASGIAHTHHTKFILRGGNEQCALFAN